MKLLQARLQSHGAAGPSPRSVLPPKASSHQLRGFSKMKVLCQTKSSGESQASSKVTCCCGLSEVDILCRLAHSPVSLHGFLCIKFHRKIHGYFDVIRAKAASGSQRWNPLGQIRLFRNMRLHWGFTATKQARQLVLNPSYSCRGYPEEECLQPTVLILGLRTLQICVVSC
jgi:hypothetical protein